MSQQKRRRTVIELGSDEDEGMRVVDLASENALLKTKNRLQFWRRFGREIVQI
jgi:hypothetical protein